VLEQVHHLAVRAEGRVFWLDVSLRETSRDDLFDTLAIPDGAVRALPDSADASAARRFHAHGQAVVFALRCCVDSEPPAGETAYRLRPLEVSVVVTGEYLLTLHEERVSLPAALAPELPRSGQRDTSSTRCSTHGREHVRRAGGVQAEADALAKTSSGFGARRGRCSRSRIEIGALRRFETSEELYFDRLHQQLDVLLG
jgi:hypothetical protein